MSTHLLAKNCAEMQDSLNVTDLFTQLVENGYSRIVQKLGQIDWPSIKQLNARQALEDTAKHFNVRLEKEYDNRNEYGTENGKPPKGTCLGVLNNGLKCQLGLAQDDMSFSFFWNLESANHNKKTLKEWQEFVERRYRELMAEVFANILSDSVTKTVEQDGSILFQFNLTKQGRLR